MLRKLAVVAAALVFPGILAAQAPGTHTNHASPIAQANMAAARARVAEHRAAHVRGWVTHMADRNSNAPLPATPAPPAPPGSRARTAAPRPSLRPWSTGPGRATGVSRAHSPRSEEALGRSRGEPTCGPRRGPCGDA